MRLPCGTQVIAKGIAKLIGHENIHISHPVVAIEEKGAHVLVTTTTRKVFEARKLIISMPSAMLKELHFLHHSPQGPKRFITIPSLGIITRLSSSMRHRGGVLRASMDSSWTSLVLLVLFAIPPWKKLAFMALRAS